VHLAFSEIWRNRGRFLLFSLVVALITILVLFVAALGEGLLGGIREYFENLNADLIVYQDTAQREAAASQVDCVTRAAIRRVEGVQAAGSIGFSTATVVADDGSEILDISLVGVEPGQPGQPPAVMGRGLARTNAYDAIVDENVAGVVGLQPGDSFIVKTIQGDEEEFYTLQVAGVSESLRYSLSASIFVPIVTWDEIRSKATAGPGQQDPACNVVAVQLEDPVQIDAMKDRIEAQVSRVEAIERRAAYESLPGYSAIRSSLNTQQTFALLIGVLVIGGFFQIQTLQKVPQIGMLKAIGTPNRIVALAAISQILIVTVVGVGIGTAVSAAVSTVFPPGIPIIFKPRSAAMAVASLLLMGPIGGLVSVRYSLRIEPLVALGQGR
jgi:putative ABC transport system permease protein